MCWLTLILSRNYILATFTYASQGISKHRMKWVELKTRLTLPPPLPMIFFGFGVSVVCLSHNLLTDAI